jgi:acyl carrier protein
MDDIRQQVKDFVLEKFLPGEDPKNLTDQTELDSLSTLKLVSFLEERFQIELEANDLEAGNLSSLTNIERLVKSKMANR